MADYKTVATVLFLMIVGSPPVLLAKVCSVHIASLNVENLFDTVADLSQVDSEFVPIESRPYLFPNNPEGTWTRRLIGWTPEKLDRKIQGIVETVGIVAEKTHDGRMPDILGLVEVESEQVVFQTAQALGYQHAMMTKSPDVRGIDNVLLWNERSGELVAIGRREHQLNTINFKDYPSRNILEVLFKVADSYMLHVLVNHWPSQGADTPVRLEVARKAYRKAEDILDRNPNSRVIMIGDFNTLDHERPSPIEDELLRRDSRIQLIDIAKQVSAPNQPEGSYFYPPKEEWSHLDRAFGSSNLLGEQGLTLRPESFKTVDDPRLSEPYELSNGETIEIPRRFNFQATMQEDPGKQDHFPIVFTIEAQIPEEKELDPIEFNFDREIFNVGSRAALFYKKSGRRKFISLEEYEREKDRIGIEGPYKNLEFKESPNGSMEAFEDSPSNDRNYTFRDLKKNIESSRSGSWKSHRYEEIKDLLMDKQTAKQVVIHVDRRIKVESVRQIFLYLLKIGEILYLPDPKNIHTQFEPFTEMNEEPN